MDAQAASDNLQVIRTLMERAALYRRALAPIMLMAGALGTVAAGAGISQHLDSVRAFTALWLGTAGVAVVSAFLLARRQAFKEQEPFWSPPTRRVAQALLPALISGFGVGLACVLVGARDEWVTRLALLWMLFYGCALHAAGFFMMRGIRLLGWLFILCAGCVFVLLLLRPSWVQTATAHGVMGFHFGLLQLACGAYLYVSEKRKNAA